MQTIICLHSLSTDSTHLLAVFQMNLDQSVPPPEIWNGFAKALGIVYYLLRLVCQNWRAAPTF